MILCLPITQPLLSEYNIAFINATNKLRLYSRNLVDPMHGHGRLMCSSVPKKQYKMSEGYKLLLLFVKFILMISINRMVKERQAEIEQP